MSESYKNTDVPETSLVVESAGRQPAKDDYRLSRFLLGESRSHGIEEVSGAIFDRFALVGNGKGRKTSDFHPFVRLAFGEDFFPDMRRVAVISLNHGPRLANSKNPSTFK